MTENIHATCVELNGYGVLITGASGSGKSDLALRLIENKKAILVSDDRTDIAIKNGILTASCPKNIEGLLEVRGIGLIQMPFKREASVKLIVEASLPSEIDRLPDASFETIEGCRIPSLKLDLLTPSAPDKVVVKLKTLLEEYKERS